ncbi:hypothetical protein Syun_029508 [Stephania yunnanensis]|uniref:Photosynthetic NDH subunit of subcomplex B 5, chloroplastic n=1 Tax=Stephania yunnanensis TaxID=152371 RepID=A0AAP0EDW6_9MAGN
MSVSTSSTIATNSIPKPLSNPHKSRVRFSPKSSTSLAFLQSKSIFNRRISIGFTRLNAGLSEIEPDLIEDKRDRWATNGVDPEDFVYGEYDGHHTYHEGHEEGTFWENVKEEYLAAEPPNGFQGLISWLFLPAVAAAMAFHVPGEYIYIGAALFTVVFCIIEMDKPDKPHNFEPQIYNMERGARDKLIADYNTMDIWDFNEKYGDLWDFTVKKDDVLKR